MLESEGHKPVSFMESYMNKLDDNNGGFLLRGLTAFQNILSYRFTSTLFSPYHKLPAGRRSNTKKKKPLVLILLSLISTLRYISGCV